MGVGEKQCERKSVRMGTGDGLLLSALFGGAPPITSRITDTFLCHGHITVHSSPASPSHTWLLVVSGIEYSVPVILMK